MKPDDISALVTYRMQRAEESLKAAEIMYDEGMPSFAMNRIYYAMFYSVQAVIVSNEISFSKHGQVKAYMNRELIKTKILSVTLGRIYNKAFEYRQKFDYVDFAEPDTDLVESYLEQARKFVDAIKLYLKDRPTALE